MTPDQIALAQRLVACPQWRWMAGMFDVDGNRFGWNTFNRQVEACTEDSEGAARWTEPCSTPDLTDPATAGCLLAMLDGVARRDGGDTFGEAVARALLAIWQENP